jgi:hypothetical protein
VEAEAVKILGKYLEKMELTRSWEIRGSNVGLNRVFELNGLRYGPYHEGDSADAEDDRGKKVKTRADEGSSKGKAVIAATRKRKMEVKGMMRAIWGLKASRCFPEELAETCAVPREVMTSPDLRESASRMLKVTEGEWHTKDLVPRVAGEDYFTPRLARNFKIFPYRRNIGSVVSAVMEKYQQESLRKKRMAPLRLVDPRRDAKAPRPNAKGPTVAAVMTPSDSASGNQEDAFTATGC